MAIRLATIHAVSRAGLQARVAMLNFAWGQALAVWSAETMAREAVRRIADTPAQANAKLVLRHITEAGGSITHRNLNRKLGYRLKPVEMKDALSALTDAGTIRSVSSQPKTRGPKTIAYVILNP